MPTRSLRSSFSWERPSGSHAATVAATAGLAVATWRRRSFSLAIATALVASPIVWLDYFALTAVPLAIARPRLSWIWFVPLATVGLEGAGLAIGDGVGTTRALVAFSVVLAVAYRHEPTTSSRSTLTRRATRRDHGRRCQEKYEHEKA